MRRLHTIAEAVPASARAVADIGYDHGLLLAMLARRENPPLLVGVELLADAEDRFRASYPELGHVALRVGSGLEPLAPHDKVSTVVIAGMGEHRMRELVDNAPPAVIQGVERLVLCPADFRNLLRPWLCANDWAAVEDHVVYDRGRAYEVMAYERATRSDPGSAESIFFGTLAGPELITYCRHLCRRHRGALAAPPSARSPILDKLRAAAVIASGAESYAGGHNG